MPCQARGAQPARALLVTVVAGLVIAGCGGEGPVPISADVPSDTASASAAEQASPTLTPGGTVCARLTKGQAGTLLRASVTSSQPSKTPRTAASGPDTTTIDSCFFQAGTATLNYDLVTVTAGQPFEAFTSPSPGSATFAPGLGATSAGQVGTDPAGARAVVRVERGTRSVTVEVVMPTPSAAQDAAVSAARTLIRG
jgi:hypothetical protein